MTLEAALYETHRRIDNPPPIFLQTSLKAPGHREAGQVNAEAVLPPGHVKSGARHKIYRTH